MENLFNKDKSTFEPEARYHIGIEQRTKSTDPNFFGDAGTIRWNHQYYLILPGEQLINAGYPTTKDYIIANPHGLPVGKVLTIAKEIGQDADGRLQYDIIAKQSIVNAPRNAPIDRVSERLQSLNDKIEGIATNPQDYSAMNGENPLSEYFNRSQSNQTNMQLLQFQLAQMQNELNMKNNEVQNLRSQIEIKNDRITEMSSQIAEARMKITFIEQQNVELMSTNKSLLEQINKFDKRINEQTQALNDSTGAAMMGQAIASGLSALPDILRAIKGNGTQAVQSAMPLLSPPVAPQQMPQPQMPQVQQYEQIPQVQMPQVAMPYSSDPSSIYGAS